MLGIHIRPTVLSINNQTGAAVAPSSAAKHFKDNTITYSLQILCIYHLYMEANPGHIEAGTASFSTECR